MTQLQTVLGFFDTIAEAQQAIQLLLAQGFTTKEINLSTRIRPTVTNTDRVLANKSSQSGRFFSTLFDSRPEGQSWDGIL